MIDFYLHTVNFDGELSESFPPPHIWDLALSLRLVSARTCAGPRISTDSAAPDTSWRLTDRGSEEMLRKLGTNQM